MMLSQVIAVMVVSSLINILGCWLYAFLSGQPISIVAFVIPIIWLSLVGAAALQFLHETIMRISPSKGRR